METENKTESTSPKRVRKAKAPDNALKQFINQALEDAKALDITYIDLIGKTSIADGMYIATGTSTRHVTSIAEAIQEKVKESYSINCHMEGADEGDWVVVDASDFIVHVFRHEVREFYNLEKLWGSDFSQANFTLYRK